MSDKRKSQRNQSHQLLSAMKMTKRKKKVIRTKITLFFPSCEYFYLMCLDDEEKLREELGDLIDDNPIEEDESSGSESGDEKSGGAKRKRDDDDDELDDRLSEDDFDLLDENLGTKIKVNLFINFYHLLV